MSTPRRPDAPILDALIDAALFAPFFPRATWRPWFVCAAVIFGLTSGLSPEDQAFARVCLGRHDLPSVQARRAFLIVGRRGGKSRFAALLAVFLACFKDYRTILAPGERGIGMVVAPDRRQSRVIFRYISALIDRVPLLAAMVDNRTKEAIHLNNGISIEVHTASFRAVRGYTIVFALVDEGAFLPVDDSAEPDTELLAALAPAMSTVPGALLLMVSTPYARRGELYRAHRDHFGKDSETLVWVADTKTMNATVDQAIIDRAFTEDASAALAEYGRDGRVEFRSDVESFVSLDVLNACVVPGRHELPHVAGVVFVAFVDPSGGSADSFTLALTHRTKENHAVVDLLREVRPPFSPESTVQDFAAVLKAYHITRVTGDRYAGEWPREQFRKHGIEYVVSERVKSDIYRDVLPLLNSGRVELLDHPHLVAQLANLERRTARGGRDSIDHAPGAHDDLANAVAGAIVLASRPRVINAVPTAVGQRPSPWGPMPDAYRSTATPVRDEDYQIDSIDDDSVRTYRVFGG